MSPLSGPDGSDGYHVAVRLSVVVVVHNMAREAPRTLRSLSPGYQRHIDAADYEVIVVDNGSDPPFDLGAFQNGSGNFRLIRLHPAPASPARAINTGLAEAKGDVIGLMVDGARLATPGLLHFARHGAALYPRAVVATLGWYLGFDTQPIAVAGGYDRAQEDALLASIDWPTDGYRLFEIGTMDESSIDGWVKPIAESNAIFLRRDFWTALGGVDERFDAPGGGLLNLDTFRRAIEMPDAELVILLGEGTFHQVHGGVSTNAPPDQQHARFHEWAAQYAAIRGRPYEVVQSAQPPTFVGTLPARVSRQLETRLASHSSDAKRHFALAEAHRLRGRHDAAIQEYRTALSHDPDLMEAHVGWASARMPGDDYLVWLNRIYRWLSPAFVLDIGIGRGDSISVVRPPAIAIGVDPHPYMFRPLQTETHIFTETSDEFFERARLSLILNGRLLSAAFIDGLHTFEQALRDFVNVESWCSPRSIVLIHDTVPLNELTQRPRQETRFHTGDLWKTVLCLKRYRPDLDIFTIAAAPTGLTVVTNLDPASRVLPHRFAEAVREFEQMSFADVEPTMDAALNLVAPDWPAIELRLRGRRERRER